MKIFAFTDVHGQYDIIQILKKKANKKDIDIVVCTGDFTWFGNHLNEILKDLNTINKPFLIIPGNHEQNSTLSKTSKNLKNIINIHKKIYEFENFNFIGFGTGGFDLFEHSFEKFIDQKSKILKTKQNLILLTH